MLEELRLQGLGVIDQASLALGPGLTVVTGETGAGKTMVVTGLLLLFGGRGDAARVRAGAEQAGVDGRLRVTDPDVAARVEAAGGGLDDDGTLVLRRLLSSSGRSRAHAGGAPVPVSVLTELADRLVSIHGQSDQLRLTRRADQLATLDRFAAVDTAAYLAAYEQWRALDHTLTSRRQDAAALRREADLLTHGIAEIEAAEPQPGEDAELDGLAARLAGADELRLAAGQAYDALAGDRDDPTDDAPSVGRLAGRARQVLLHAAGSDPRLEEFAARAAEIGVLAAELAGELVAYGEALDADPTRLAAVEERRALLRALIRKYGEPTQAGSGSVGAVLAWAEAARDRLAGLDVSDEALAELAARRDAAAEEAARLADALTAQRTRSAEDLSAAVSQELAGLAMAGAALRVKVCARAGTGALETGDGRRLGPDGADDVEFLLRPHSRSPEVPLARGASGGELSRVMLALEVCLAGTDPVPTMIFDEVDAGVGGRAAVEVGRRLALLARSHQVIVVTHLAQVAAYADHHIVVDKGAGDENGPEGRGIDDASDAGDPGVVASDVRPVAAADRVAELARMLGGTDSAAARRHARELLATAAADRAASVPNAR